MPFDLIDPKTMPAITAFTIRAPVSVEQLGVMAAAWRELKTLDIRNVIGGAPLVRTNIPFPLLETLLVKGGAESPLRLLSYRDMPALCSLSIVCDTNAQSDFFASFLGPGPCTSLRSLSLSGKYVHAVPGSFNQLPELRSLCISSLEGRTAQAFFESWKLPVIARHPAKLADLRVENCAFGLAGPTMLDFLGHRQAGNAKLRRLFIVQHARYKDAGDIFPAWMAPRLRQLVDEVTIDTSTSVKLCPRSDD
ncbi:hypothetical protein AURDEDRAFT_171432 [Auricularia subglabra TFB-10046 SS5]|nr:hypothetical protein AURDEDRAFT_171432 [Auricularia subglabra TFB-10046 SS5]